MTEQEYIIVNSAYIYRGGPCAGPGLGAEASVGRPALPLSWGLPVGLGQLACETSIKQLPVHLDHLCNAPRSWPFLI